MSVKGRRPILSGLVFLAVTGLSQPAQAGPDEVFGGRLMQIQRAVGFLSSLDGRQYCTFTMIDSRRALTAGHCISSQKQCDETLGNFTEDGTTVSANYQCKKYLGGLAPPPPKQMREQSPQDSDPHHKHVKTREELQLEIENDGNVLRDYALIEFEGAPGDEQGSVPLHFMKPGEYKNKTAAYRIKYDPPTRLKPRTVLNVSRCDTIAEAEVPGALRLTDSEDEVNTFGPCHVVRGNSGGPVFNELGELIGISDQIEARGIAELNAYEIEYLTAVSIETVVRGLPELKSLLR